jgi:hypothetical protein
MAGHFLSVRRWQDKGQVTLYGLGDMRLRLTRSLLYACLRRAQDGGND